MQAIVLTETGGVDKLRWESIPAPDPTDGQVLLRVHAAAVNPVDWKYRRGLIDTRLPMVPGSDVSGVVEVSRSADFAVGDAVCGMAASGAYAELATANERHLAHKPHGVTHERAAAVPVSGLTAWQTLFDGGARRYHDTVARSGDPARRNTRQHRVPNTGRLARDRGRQPHRRRSCRACGDAA